MVTAQEPDPQPTPTVKPPDKHMFGVLPNYRTADPTQPFRALTVKEKFTIARHDSFDPPQRVRDCRLVHGHLSAGEHES